MKKKQILISEVLPRLLKQKSITAKELATQTGISPSTLSSWTIKGAKPRNIDDVALAAEVLGVSLNTLLFDEAEIPSDLLAVNATTILEGTFRLKLEKIDLPQISKNKKR